MPTTSSTRNAKSRVEVCGNTASRWARCAPLQSFKRLLVQPHLALVGLQLTAQRTQQRAFARAIGAQHAEHFARQQVEGDIRQHGLVDRDGSATSSTRSIRRAPATTDKEKTARQ